MIPFSVTLPESWECWELKPGADESLQSLVSARLDAFSGEIPPDTLGPLLVNLAKRIESALARAHENGATDLFMPTQSWHGVLNGSSFVVAAVDPHAHVPSEITTETYAPLVISEFLADPDARSIIVGESSWVRRTGLNEPEPGAAPSVWVTYLTPMPQSPGRWATVSFVTFGDGDPTSHFTRLCIELFDAIMSTWQWAADDEPAQS